MRLVISLALTALAAFAQSFKPGETIEYKSGITLIKARGTSFQPDLDFSNRMGAQGTHSVHIGYAASAKYGPSPKPESYFGTWLLHAANRGSHSYTTSGGRPVVQTTDSQAESGQLTINPDGTYAWQVLRGQSTVLKGNWRWARPEEMHV